MSYSNAAAYFPEDNNVTFFPLFSIKMQNPRVTAFSTRANHNGSLDLKEDVAYGSL